MTLAEILLEDESEFLDFKERFHDNNVKLLHDILCLVNAYSDGDRYLVFGVKDDKTVCGVDSDPNKKNTANFQDLLRQSKLNRIPTVVLRSYNSPL